MKCTMAFAVLVSLCQPGWVWAAKKSECGGVAIDFSGIDRLETSGRSYELARFRLENNSGRLLKFPLSDEALPAFLHPRYFVYEKRSGDSGGAWSPYALTLSSYFSPNAWLYVGPKSSVAFFSEGADIKSAGEEHDLEFRLRIEDVSGCRYFSEPFKLSAFHASVSD